MPAQKLFDGFETTALGAVPTEFLNVAGAGYATVAAGAIGGVHAFGPPTGGDGLICLYNTVLAGDFCVQWDETVHGDTGNFASIGFVVAASDDSISNGYVVNTGPLAGTIAAYKKTGGAYAVLAQTGGTFTPIPAGNIKRTKVQREGTTVKIRVWDGATAEPATWSSTFSDATYTGGKLALRSFNNGTPAVAPAVDNFYAGEAGVTFPGATIGTVTGSGTATVGTTQTFALTLDQPDTTTFTPVLTGTAAGTLSGPVTLTNANTATFTILWSSAGSAQVNGTFGDGVTPGAYQAVTVAPPMTTPATGYTLAASASSATAGDTITLTATPVGGILTGSITLNPSGAGAPTTPIVLTFAGTSAPRTATIATSAAGTLAVASSNSAGLANPSALAITVAAAPVISTTGLAALACFGPGYAGLAGTIGVTWRDAATGTVAQARATAGVRETVSGATGSYVAALATAVAGKTYVATFDTGGSTPVYQDLEVSAPAAAATSSGSSTGSTADDLVYGTVLAGAGSTAGTLYAASSHWSATSGAYTGQYLYHQASGEKRVILAHVVATLSGQVIHTFALGDGDGINGPFSAPPADGSQVAPC